MKAFFKSVRRHIGKLDAEHLREQYGRIAEEFTFLENVFQAMNEAVIVTDETGSCVFENLAVREILGMDGADALPLLGVSLDRTSKTELSIGYPEPKSLEVKVVPLDGRSVVLVRDTTAEKAAAAAEMESGATRAVEVLASGMAHEISNPLNALSLNLQLLQTEAQGEAAETIKVCLEQVERIASYSRDFLQAMRPRRPVLKRGMVTDPVKRCLATLRETFESRRISVTVNVPSALPAVAIDSDQMEQVFFNLLKNALEAVKDGGAIEIAIEADDNDVTVRFSDNGIGMDAEQVAHLFEPYRTAKKHGTGLGLMITARIVREHGGAISAESRIGEGTVFTVRLPRIERRIRTLK